MEIHKISNQVLPDLQISNGFNKTRINKRFRRGAEERDSINKDDTVYLKGFIENISYEDVFGRSKKSSTKSEGVNSRVVDEKSLDTRYDDSDVWAILVTPKPMLVGKEKTLLSNRYRKKKKEKTKKHTDLNIRQQKRKIGDLAIKSSTTQNRKQKQEKNPIKVHQTEFGEKFFPLLNIPSMLKVFDIRHIYNLSMVAFLTTYG